MFVHANVVAYLDSASARIGSTEFHSVSLPLLGTGRERKPQLLNIGRPNSTYRALSFGPGVICRNPQLGVAGEVLVNLQDQAIEQLPVCDWVRSAVGLAS